MPYNLAKKRKRYFYRAFSCSSFRTWAILQSLRARGETSVYLLVQMFGGNGRMAMKASEESVYALGTHLVARSRPRPPQETEDPHLRRSHQQPRHPRRGAPRPDHQPTEGHGHHPLHRPRRPARPESRRITALRPASRSRAGAQRERSLGNHGESHGSKEKDKASR